MRKTSVALLALLALPSGLLAEDRVLQGTANVSGDGRIVLDFPVGELHVEGASAGPFLIEVSARCKRDRDRCEERLDDVAIEIVEKRGNFYVEVAPHSKWRWWNSLQLEASVRHPADTDLEIDMGVGELEIEGVRGDLRVDLGVGEVRIDLELADFASVQLDAGIGETELLVPDGWIEGDRSFLVGSESHWRDGPGESRVRVDVGVGEAVVRLDD